MKCSVAFVAATLWITDTSAFAQRGRPASPGAVAPSMHGSSTCADHASSRPTTSPSSPDSVLTRSPQLSGALTEALAKSGAKVSDLAERLHPSRH